MASKGVCWMKQSELCRLVARTRFVGLVAAVPALLTMNRASVASPWATQVLSYDAGTNPESGYSSDASVALGLPERVTGENTPFGSFPSDVTMFNSPYGVDEIVSIGEGGQLTLQLGQPAVDDPTHLYGADLIVFGNMFFNTDDFVTGNITGMAPDPASIEVSGDNMHWFPISTTADGLFPTQAYLDSGIFGTNALGAPDGSIPSDYFRPMNPALSINDFLGLSYADALDLYAGSGGGTAIDIAETGLSSVSFIRFSVPVGAGYNAEIDAVTLVPEPVTIWLLSVGGLLVGIRQRRSRT